MSDSGIEYEFFAGRSAMLEVSHDDMTITWWMHSKRMNSIIETQLKLELAKMIYRQSHLQGNGYRLIGDDLRQFQGHITGFEVA